MVKKDLNIIFTSFVQSNICTKVKDFFIRSGYAILESVSKSSIDQNENRDKVLVLYIEGGNFPKAKEVALLKNKSPDLPCFCVIHANGTQLDAEVLSYCDEFVVWPCDQNELFYRMHGLLAHLSNKNKLNLLELDEPCQQMIGHSEIFQQVLKRVKVFSNCDAPVLIEGETGTGKEMVARAIHYYSERRDHPFIPVNCGALPDNLIENELFGHIKGAYTDAKSSSKGLVGQAFGGTLFLDEVESLSSKGQVALLRLLQEQEYKPLGSTKPIKANIRIVTASNISLKMLLRQEVIRQDLYYRLNILSVTVPPLRKRENDALLLANYFVNEYRIQYHQYAKQLHESSVKWIRTYKWPGNVRELENLMHRAFLIAEGNYICEHHFDESCLESDDDLQKDIEYFPTPDINFNEAKLLVINNFEKRYLSRLMERFGGNVTLAAKKACKERRAFGKLLKKHGIDRIQYMQS